MEVAVPVAMALAPKSRGMDASPRAPSSRARTGTRASLAPVSTPTAPASTTTSATGGSWGRARTQCVAPVSIAASTATTPTRDPARLSESAAAQPGTLAQSFEKLEALAQQVQQAGACSLPGCSFCFEVFIPIMLRAVQRGFVTQESAAFVRDGLRFGFLCGVDVDKMKGKRKFTNYPTAFAASSKVSDAVRKRVVGAKTWCLGAFWRRLQECHPV